MCAYVTLEKRNAVRHHREVCCIIISKSRNLKSENIATGVIFTHVAGLNGCYNYSHSL